MKNLLEQLQQLAPLAATATAGPWALCSPAFAEAINTADDKQHIALANIGPGIPHMANAAFIAAARNLLTPENLTLLVAALVPQWVAVAERMPVPAPDAASGSLTSVAVLVLLNNGKQMVGNYGSRWKEWRSEDGNTPLFDSVTHWMPLPAAPATIKGNPAHV